LSIIVRLAEHRDEALRRAGLSLRAGELVVVPTDTVYGLAADAFNASATNAVFDVKSRPRALPLPVLVSRPKQAWALCDSVPPGAAELAGEFWPGALTMILPQTPDLSWDLGESNGTIAIRMPNHPDLLDLLEMVGPLAVTSANLSGEPTPPRIEEIQERLGEQIAVYVDGGAARRKTGSTIVDLARAHPVIVRSGPIPAREIERALGVKIARA
jgi:L-threonylcarbamoyladenylate synthase